MPVNSINVNTIDLEGRVDSASQLDVMPTASASYLNQIVQFVGTTTSDYTNGYFYKCTLNGSTYSWNRINVQPGGGGGGDIEVVQTTGQSTTAVMSQKAVTDELDERAKIDGVYESMVVGSAMAIAGDTPTTSEFTFRATAGTKDVGSSIAQIKKMRGKSMVWNQQGFDLLGELWRGANATTSVVGNYRSFTATARFGGISSGLNYVSVVSGHKYLIMIDFYTEGSVSMCDFSVGVVGANFGTNIVNPTPQTWLHYDWIATAGATGTAGVGIRDFDQSDWTEKRVKNLMFIDLTQMFGAGNEPSTVEQFRALFPLDYYPYNAGQVVHFNPTGIKTTGFNQLKLATGKVNALPMQYQITGTYTAITQNGETITPDANGLFTPAQGELTITGGDATTCVHLVHSGRRNGQYEAYQEHTLPLDFKVNGQSVQFRSAGTAKDEPIIDADGYSRKYTKRIGEVNLGSLEWRGTSVFYVRYYDAKGTSLNLLCNRFSPAATYVADWDLLQPDTMEVHSAQHLCIRPSATYADAAAFKAAMNGVMLYYELATPVQVTFDSPVYMNYNESDWGTEMLLPQNTTTPTTTPTDMDIVYPINAIDTLNNLNRNFVSMGGQSDTSQMKVLLQFLTDIHILASYNIGDYNATTGTRPITGTKYTE